MPNNTNHTPEPLLSALTLEQGAAIAALPEPARTSVLASLQLRASDTAPVMDEGTFGENQAAELLLAARAAMLDVDPLEILRGDPFDRSNMASHSTQFDRLMCGYSYRRFCAEHPADQQLEFSGEPSAFVGLVQGGPGTSSWHAHGDTVSAVQALAEDHADEGLELVTIWDLRTGKRAVTDFVVALTVHVQAYTADDAYEHVVERLDDLDSEIHSSDEDAVPAVHHLHAAGPFFGPARSEAESVESIPQLWHFHTAKPLPHADPVLAASQQIE